MHIPLNNIVEGKKDVRIHEDFKIRGRKFHFQTHKGIKKTAAISKYSPSSPIQNTGSFMNLFPNHLKSWSDLDSTI